MAIRDLGTFISKIETECWAQALAFLNEGVPHRYTAAYRIRESIFENVALHDKKGEVRPDFLAAVPFEASFCQFVLRDGVFMTEDSARDGRLDGHPYQGVMISYHGVPIAETREHVVGTLCHFDVTELGLPDPGLSYFSCKSVRFFARPAAMRVST